MPNSPAEEQRINAIRFLSGRCRTKGQLRPSGHADGRGGDGVHALDASSALQSEGPALAQSRPLRTFGRPRLDAALRAALSDRLRLSRSTTSRVSASSEA